MMKPSDGNMTVFQPVTSPSLYNLKLQGSLQRIRDNLIVVDTEQPDHKVPQPHMAPVEDLSQQEGLYGLAKRVVAVESLVFLSKQFDFMHSYLQHLQGDSPSLQQFFSQVHRGSQLTN